MFKLRKYGDKNEVCGCTSKDKIVFKKSKVKPENFQSETCEKFFFDNEH